MEEPAYKLEPQENGWLVYINEGLDREELSEFLDYLTQQSIRKRNGDADEDASTLSDGILVDVRSAETNLSELIEKACAGEEVVIARGTTPVVRLAPVSNGQPRRRFGALKGKLVIPEEFFDPLPADELEAWGQ